MDRVPKTRCPYFEARFVEAVLPAPLKSRRVSTPICRLAEIMLVRLRATAGGGQIGAVLTLTSDHAAPRSMYGCDLAPAERQSCSTQRLHTRCEPGFVKFLAHPPRSCHRGQSGSCRLQQFNG